MQKLQKIDENTNVLTWFEIPVVDTMRAKRFYETILDIQMVTRVFESSGETLTFFPYNADVLQASSGRVTGVLVKSANAEPSAKGPLIYLNASPRIDDVIDRIERAGGKLLASKTKIPPGYFAIFLDTEGNRVAIHAEQ